MDMEQSPIYSILFLLTIPRRCFYCGSVLLFMVRVCLCHTDCLVCFMEPCGNLMGKRWPLDSLECDCFLLVIVTFQCVVLGQVWYLIILIPDICLLPYFFNNLFLSKLTAFHLLSRNLFLYYVCNVKLQLYAKGHA